MEKRTSITLTVVAHITACEAFSQEPATPPDPRGDTGRHRRGATDLCNTLSGNRGRATRRAELQGQRPVGGSRPTPAFKWRTIADAQPDAQPMHNLLCFYGHDAQLLLGQTKPRRANSSAGPGRASDPNSLAGEALHAPLLHQLFAPTTIPALPPTRASWTSHDARHEGEAST